MSLETPPSFTPEDTTDTEQVSWASLIEAGIITPFEEEPLEYVPNPMTAGYEHIEGIEAERDSSLVTPEISREKAQQLLERYNDQIEAGRGKDIDNLMENGEYVGDFSPSISYFIENSGIPNQILQSRVGHGIVRGSREDQVTSAINILENSMVLGDFGPLKGSGDLASSGAWTNGGFLVLADKERPFVTVEGTNHILQVETGAASLGTKFNWGALVLNAEFYPLHDELQKAFPGRLIIKAHQLPEYLIKDQAQQ